MSGRVPHDGRIVAVDVGGTFTDVVAIVDGAIVTSKVPTDVSSSDRSVLAGAMEVDVGAAAVFNLASTAGLNAVITRKLPKVAVLTTEGHRDVLDGGRIGRPLEALTDPGWRRGFGDVMAPLVPRYLRRNIRERVLADGSVLVNLDEKQARIQLRVLKKCDVRGIAICLINAYANGDHERRLRELVLEEIGDVPCSLSSEVSPLSKEYVRSSTTLIDALMKVIYTEYTARLAAGLAEAGFTGRFNYADSRAMLLAADYAMERPYELVAGGPAAGTVASAHFGHLIGDHQLVCADVGGTSTDISVVIDGLPYTAPTFELEYDLVVNALSNDIITLGAGGGSIVRVAPTGDISTGPASAGADPGPASYGAGGTEPTLTDAAVVMGILDPQRFLGGKKPLYPDLAVQAFDSLDTKLPFDQRVRFAWDMGLNNVAEGLINISIRRGIDLREYSLVAFGAGGPMMLTGLLDVLPMRRVIVPPHPGLFSALGLVSSDRVYSDHLCRYMSLSNGDDAVAAELDHLFNDMERRLLERAGVDRSSARVVRNFDGRLAGQSWETPFIDVPDGTITIDVLRRMATEFHDVYERRNGNRFGSIGVEGVVYRVQVFVDSDKVTYQVVPKGNGAVPARSTVLRYLYGDDVPAHEYDRPTLGVGDVIEGPAIVREELSTTLVPRGRTATVGRYGELSIE
jgi:N-methylhydantoinase A